MKKSIFLFVSMLVLLGAGCQSSQQMAVKTDAKAEVEQPASGTAETSASDCSAIQSTDHKPLFDVQDAATLFGGTWKTRLEPQTKTSGVGCIYMLTEDSVKASLHRRGVTVQTQTKDEFDRLMSERNVKVPETTQVMVSGQKMDIKVPKPTYTDIPQLGDQAVLLILDDNTTSPMLYIHQGDRYFVINAEPATQEQIMAVAKIILTKGASAH